MRFESKRVGFQSSSAQKEAAACISQILRIPKQRSPAITRARTIVKQVLRQLQKQSSNSVHIYYYNLSMLMFTNSLSLVAPGTLELSRSQPHCQTKPWSHTMLQLPIRLRFASCYVSTMMFSVSILLSVFRLMSRTTVRCDHRC